MSAAKYVQKFCKCARKGKIYFYYVKYLKYCLRKNNKCVSLLSTTLRKSSQIILKLMAIANVADLLRKNSNAHSCLQQNMYRVMQVCTKGKIYFYFYSIWQYQFSFQTCFHQVRVPPPHLPPPDPCIYLYCYTTLSCSVLSHRE